MDKWVLFALISMFFAGVTAVIAKLGLDGISAEAGLTIRTCFVFVFVLLFAWVALPRSEVMALSWTNYGWLAASALATALSWGFYFKALKLGNVSTVALIDKGSFVVAVVLAWVILQEQITVRVVLGCGLIVTGLVVVAQK